MQGKCIFWNHDRGYGFLKGDDGEDYFAHVTALLGGQSLETCVEFELATNLRNKRIHAAQVRVVG